MTFDEMFDAYRAGVVRAVTDSYDDWVEQLPPNARERIEQMNGRITELATKLTEANAELARLTGAGAALNISHWECANCGREWDHDPEPVETLFCRSGGGSACAEYAVSWKDRAKLAETRLSSAHDVEQAIRGHLRTARDERDEAREQLAAGVERERLLREAGTRLRQMASVWNSHALSDEPIPPSAQTALHEAYDQWNRAIVAPANVAPAAVREEE